jgi:hypothetical protein
MGHLDTEWSLPVVGADKTGFSPTAKKLRLAPNQRVVVLNAPDGFLGQLRPGPSGIMTELQANQAYDAVFLFVKDSEELRPSAPSATPWWVQRDVLGEITSETGYKPVAFEAVDGYWTALRFKRV